MNVLRDVARRLGIYSPAQQDTQSKKERLQELLQNARRDFLAGKFEEALKFLANAEILNSGDPDFTTHVLIMISKAGIYARQKQYAEAATILNDAENQIIGDSHERLSALVHIGKGVLEQEQGRLDTAEKHYEAAMKLARLHRVEEIEGRAQGHLADIALVQNNASFASYLLREALPKLRDSADFELHSYFMGRMGQALIALGEEREGEQYLSRALRVAEHMGYLTFERMWRRTLADRALEREKYNDARRHLVALLARSEHDSADYVSLLINVSKVCQRLGEYNAGLDYARQAYELAEKLALGTQTIMEAQMAVGIHLRYLGKLDKARDQLAPPVETFRQHQFQPQTYSSVEMLRNVAAICAELGDFDEALVMYGQAMMIAQETENELDIAGTLRDQGILFARKGQLDDAINNWTRALQIYDQQGHLAQVARLYCDMANLHKQLGEPQRALEEYGKALILLGSIEDEETRGIVLANAAAAYVEQGDLESAESFFIESIKIAQRMGDRQAEATRRGNYGWFLLSTGRADRAIASLSYALRQSENLNLPLQVAVQTDNMGLAQMELGNFHEALKFHKRAWEKVQQVEVNHWKATISANLAHGLLHADAIDQAQSWIEQSLNIDVDNNRSELKARQLAIAAEINLLDGDISIAESQLNDSLQLAKQLQSKRLLADVLRVRSEMHHKMDRNSQAQQDWDQAMELYSLLHLPLEPRTPRWVQFLQQKI